MNPFDLPGPQYLQLYAGLMLAVVPLALWWRRQLRLPADPVPPVMLNLSPIEVAYLAGKVDLALRAALAGLVHQGAVTVNGAERSVTAVPDVAPRRAEAVESAILSAARGGATISALEKPVAAALEPLRRRMQNLGILLDDARAGGVRLLPALLVATLCAFGIVKIVVGISRDRPVGFLVVLCILTFVIALLFLKPAWRSRRGDVALAGLRRSYAALQRQAMLRIDSLPGSDLMLFVGLFGMNALTAAAFADLRLAVQPPPGSGSGCGASDSSCGSSCGGGGGCGGCGG